MFCRLGNDTGWSQPSSPLNSMEYANGTEKDELLMGNAWNSLWGYSRCQHCMYSQQSMVLACILRMLCSSVICQRIPYRREMEFTAKRTDRPR